MTENAATTHIALIRGINVGPNKRVAMAALRNMLTGLGYQDVRTHLNSGNAIFSATGPPAAVAEAVERGLAQDLQVIGFLRDEPAKKAVAEIPELADDADTAPDQVRLVGDHLYLWCPNGSLNATFSKVNWDRKLGTVVTVRNWNTVTKLADIAAP